MNIFPMFVDHLHEVFKNKNCLLLIFLLDFQNPTDFYITLILCQIYVINCVYNFGAKRRSFTFLCHQCINLTLISTTFELSHPFPDYGGKFPPFFIFLAILMHLFFLHMKIKLFSQLKKLC